RLIELDDIRLVSVKRENPALLVDGHRGHLAPGDAGRQRTPSLDKSVRLILSACGRLQNRDRERDEREKDGSFHAGDYRTHLVAQSKNAETGSGSCTRSSSSTS